MAEIDYAFIGTVYGVAFLLVGFVVIWKRLGGWPEAWYRIRRIPYFTQHVILADGSVARFVHRMKLIQHRSPPAFDYSSRTWDIDYENQVRDNGRPSWYYNHDDSRPIPLMDWGKGKNHLDSKIPPGLIFSAFHDGAIEKMHGMGQKKTPSYALLVLVLVFLVFVVTVAGLYYQYNTFCGINPVKC